MSRELIELIMDIGPMALQIYDALARDYDYVDESTFREECRRRMKDPESYFC